MKKKSITSVDDGVSKFSHIFNVGEKAARPFSKMNTFNLFLVIPLLNPLSKTSSGNIQKTKS